MNLTYCLACSCLGQGTAKTTVNTHTLQAMSWLTCPVLGLYFMENQISSAFQAGFRSNKKGLSVVPAELMISDFIPGVARSRDTAGKFHETHPSPRFDLSL